MSDTVGKWGKRETSTSDNLAWASEQRVYEWRDDYTLETAPDDPGLEADLFDEENRVNTGINFKNYAQMKVSVRDGPPNLEPLQTKNAIPILAKNYDLMACAQTGSGKTAAFLVPIISMILKKIVSGRIRPARSNVGQGRFKALPLVLVILPTRELAIQLFEESLRFAYKTPLRPVAVYGGASPAVQNEQVRRGCDILIATPGRLQDMIERGNISLAFVRHVVLDEADRMLDMGFEPQIRKIMLSSNLPRDESLQTLMFSATFPNQIQVLARDFLKEDYCRLRIGRIGGTTTDITQRVLYVNDFDKNDTVVEILLEIPPSRTMIFVQTKRTADSLDDYLYNKMFPTCSIHGDRNQAEREQSLRAFKTGRSPILIATAVASRGLDIKDVMHVINYDLCDDIDEYVHRIGRTARAGNHGLATSFYNEKYVSLAPQLTKLLQECEQEIPEFLKSYVDPDVTYETEEFLDEEEIQGLGGDGDGDDVGAGDDGSAWDANTGDWGMGDDHQTSTSSGW
ncbi:hypothetical protein BGZ98_000989 [Dissophora globulifera]|nr:hypothetical protein BGZ98_000989 [Dissophora globulifera]